MDKQPLLDLYTAFAGAAPQAVDAITGSGSNRQYFRVTSAAGHTVIGVIGTSVEENHAFITLAHHFREKGLSVPQVLAVSADERCYLQEDLGTRSLFDALKDGREAGGQYSEREQELLRRTIAQLPRLQILGGQGLDFSVCYPQPEMDETNVMFDLNYFKYCFLKPSGIDFHELRLEQDFRALAKDLLSPDSPPALPIREGVECSEQASASPSSKETTPLPRREGQGGESTFLYRDFQARNVLLDAAGNPCFIDFQGGRRGPIYYDLASFLWQASARYPQALREELIEVYRKSLEEVMRVVSGSKFQVSGSGPSSFKFQVSSFRLFVLFRLLQVLGAYGYRGYFERKKHFLDSIPPALDNLRDLLKDEGSCPYPELRKVLEALTKSQDRISPSSPNVITPLSAREGQGGESVVGESVGGESSLVVRVFSFSFKRGIPEDESGNGGGYVFDCRSTHNPGRYEPYKQLTGLDAPVIKFLEDDGEILTFLDSVYRLADAHVERYLQRGFTDLMFSFGCTGGQHRSVYSAQHLAEHLHAKYGIRVILNHREQGIHKVLE